MSVSAPTRWFAAERRRRRPVRSACLRRDAAALSSPSDPEPPQSGASLRQPPVHAGVRGSGHRGDLLVAVAECLQEEIASLATLQVPERLQALGVLGARQGVLLDPGSSRIAPITVRLLRGRGEL